MQRVEPCHAALFVEQIALAEIVAATDANYGLNMECRALAGAMQTTAAPGTGDSKVGESGNQPDQLYAERQAQVADFAFDQAVTDVFPDMIRRSVPGYETVLTISGLIAARHLPEGGLAYDLGCSRGAGAQALISQLDARACRIVAVDESAAMVAEATRTLTDERIEVRQENLLETPLHGAHVILLNYVLQFLPPSARAGFLARCHAQMADGGLLILSEKTNHPEAETRHWQEAMHRAWKQANGYSALEISQKREALERVMRVDSEATHLARLSKAGFGRVRTWFRCLNWASFVAEKAPRSDSAT